MKVYVGSLNRVKVNAVKDALAPYGFEVVELDAKSLVSAQPKNDEETILGAKNRALALPKDGLRIGLEAGVEKIGDILFLTNYGVLVDQKENIYYAGGTRLPLPKQIADLIDEGYELSVAMDSYFKTVDIKHNFGAIGFFTDDVVTRTDNFVHITKLLIGQYFYKQKRG